MDLTVRPLTAERWPVLEDLFGRAGASNGCHTRDLFSGVTSALARHGFRVVARRKPDRPVMRRDLGGAA